MNIHGSFTIWLHDVLVVKEVQSIFIQLLSVPKFKQMQYRFAINFGALSSIQQYKWVKTFWTYSSPSTHKCQSWIPDILVRYQMHDVRKCLNEIKLQLILHNACINHECVSIKLGYLFLYRPCLYVLLKYPKLIKEKTCE